jgi:hypothetical protein
MNEVSGSFMASSGVGTQITTASHSATREKSVVALSSPLSTIVRSSSPGTSGM